MSNQPPIEVPQGAIRLNTETQRLEFFAQDRWYVMATDVPTLNNNTLSDNLGGARGIIGSGASIPASSGATNIDFITIPTQGNATAFGTLTYGNAYRGGLASKTRGIFINGQNDQTTEFITISSTGTVTSFGEITNDNMGGATFSNQVKGFRAGGSDAGSHTDQIIAMTISTTSSFFDFGNLVENSTYMNGCGSPTRGIIMGGANPSGDINTIQYLSMGSEGDAVDFGDLTKTRKYINWWRRSIKIKAKAWWRKTKRI